MIDPARSKLPFDPEVQPSARPLLTKTVYSALRDYLDVLERYARQHSLPVSRVEISGFQDPEEGSQQLVIAIWMGLSGKETMEQWHEMGRALEDWVSGLPDVRAATIAEWIAMEVYSDVDGAAA